MKNQVNQVLEKKHELVYNLYGIYVDWQIDHNIFGDRIDPHGIHCFEDFLNSSQWQIAKVRIASSERLIFDINLRLFNYCKVTKLEKTVLEEAIPGTEVTQRIKEWYAKTGLAPLYQMTYYLKGESQYLEMFP